MISRKLTIIPGLGRTGFGRGQIYPDISILSILSISSYGFSQTFSSPGPAIFRPFVRALEGVDFLEKGLARDPGRRQVPHGNGVHLSRATTIAAKRRKAPRISHVLRNKTKRWVKQEESPKITMFMGGINRYKPSNMG